MPQSVAYYISAAFASRSKFGYACNLYTRDKLLYFYILTAAAAPSSSSSSSSSHSQSSILNPHSSFVILSPFSQHTAYSAPQPPATRADPTRCGAVRCSPLIRKPAVYSRIRRVRIVYYRMYIHTSIIIIIRITRRSEGPNNIINAGRLARFPR